ncbi:MAG TPA: histidinol-phosphatase [Actinomycetota bacterium]|nr:histidinol-phosphatase [Actinomycetota bacterium]
MNDDLAFAHQLADVADSISMKWFRAVGLRVETKADFTPVSEADRGVEEALREHVASERDGEGVIGEEFGAEEAPAGRWILDPIDGTKNFVRGIPIWATLIALERDGVVQAGLASAPALGRRWWAARGEGAFADGDRISVSMIDRLENAQVCFGGVRTWKKAGLLENFLSLATRAQRTRGFGDFWMHMLVAEGAADVAAEMEVSIWDLAAVQVIVEEAGGAFTDITGKETPSGGSAVSTNRLLHDEVLRVLNQGAGG